MFNKIFIIEDTNSDIGELKDFLKLLPFNENQIVTLTNINNAFNEIKAIWKQNEFYLAFIDVLWKKKESGITLAKTIKKTFSNIKVIAFTSIGEGGNIDKIKENFHGFLEKETSNPHPEGIQYIDLDLSYIEAIAETTDFYHKQSFKRNSHRQSIMKNYFFKTVTEEKIVGQFLIADFCRFSTHDDDQQLNRFKILQNAILSISQSDTYKSLNIVYLPTGDGVAVGIINQNTFPYAVELSFDLISHLRNHFLERELRIGIHFGHAYILIGEKGEAQLIGPGINMASRIESAGTPGAILVSDEYCNLFLNKQGDTFCLGLTLSDSKPYTIKTDTFSARYVSKGTIASFKPN